MHVDMDSGIWPAPNFVSKNLKPITKCHLIAWHRFTSPNVKDGVKVAHLLAKARIKYHLKVCLNPKLSRYSSWTVVVVNVKVRWCGSALPVRAPSKPVRCPASV